ncbi:DNA polymerase III subunit delta [Janibacter terrae]|uniref:DNA-directed DNA polymerase n=1 Tax=Janibacter terrae TaxID=103817 RepID=A0ABZ2FEI5_9MICO|nr:DNA polymerase III subunit delta [Janibacter terrae]HBO54503.1 DNA polymerase III subunit delta [Janibacter terrae]HCE61227.1 DNA polymerase III subunit delta [Janibacter terrae]
MSTPPFVLVQGPETVLADRAVDQVVADVRVGAPDLEVVTLRAEGYEEGELSIHAGPSLFGEDKVIVVRDLHLAPDVLQLDLLAYLADPEDGVTLVVTHASGNKGKKVLDTLKKARALVLEAPAIKSDRDKAEFVTNEFRRARRKADAGAVQALVEAVGKDVRELASACQQLVDDTTGVIDADVVERYHGGRVEATGFKVADAAVAGQTGEALRLLRHAVNVGVDPVPIVAVLAQQLRQLARVGGAGRGRSADLARELGMAPWQVDKARRALQGWGGDALGRSIQAVAAADFEVKGGGRDPVYAVEKAVLTITRERNGG